jgi:hypothetical protein
MRRKIEWEKGSQALLFSMYLILIGFVFAIFMGEIGNQAIASTQAQTQADVVVDAALNNAWDIYGLDPTVANFTGYVVLAMNNADAKYPASIIMNQDDNIVNVKTAHKIRNYFSFMFCFTDNSYCFINIQKNFFQTEKQMKLVAFLFYIIGKLTLYAVHSEFCPFKKYFFYSHNLWNAAYKNIKITAE